MSEGSIFQKRTNGPSKTYAHIFFTYTHAITKEDPSYQRYQPSYPSTALQNSGQECPSVRKRISFIFVMGVLGGAVGSGRPLQARPEEKED